MIPEEQYNVARESYFEAMRQRDEARAENERLRAALQAISRACTDEDYPYIEATVAHALHWERP
jgi:hypothetical protein